MTEIYTPGNADVPVGNIVKKADEDVGDPGTDKDVGDPDADGDVGDPGRAFQPVREWYSRGYLPHRDAPRLIQSVTYRLADSLPQEKLKLLCDELVGLADDRAEIERRKRIEEWLDAGLGCCALGHPEVAHFVQKSWLRFHGERYHLHAWCVMPNHVHVLVEPQRPLSVVVQGWKSFTARWILRQNQRLALRIPEENRLWMREYWDRFIRNAEHYRNVVEYIHRNPVKAGLCCQPEDWPWSSANAKFRNARERRRP